MDAMRRARFPMPGIYRFLTLFWLGILGVAALVLLGIALLGTVTGSVWDSAAQAAMWFGLVITAMLVARYFPAYVANGVTRREYVARVWLFAGLFSALLAGLSMAAYLLEWSVYGLVGWPHELTGQRLYRSVTEVPLVLLLQLLNCAAFVALGALLGAAYYRDFRFGLVLTVLGVVPLWISNTLLTNWGGDGRGTWLGDLRAPAPLAIGTLITLALIGLKLGGMWLVLRRAPVKRAPA